MIKAFKANFAKIKPYLRWFILGITLFFLLQTLKNNWSEVKEIRLDLQGILMLGISLLVTLMAHLWSGWVWTWILKLFKQKVNLLWALQVYLKTNLAKYLPGNIWHFYGRITAISKATGSVGIASLVVLLEPILMATSALLLALISNSLGIISTASDYIILSCQMAIAILILVVIHPKILNPIIHFLSRLKGNNPETEPINLEVYPLLPLIGEFCFLLIRGTGFVFSLLAFMAIPIHLLPQFLSAFSFAWLLGLVIPGAPGGVGVFETTAIALLDPQYFPRGVILSTVVVFRFISIIAEVIAAALGYLGDHKDQLN
jgi:glycosyltransferase 2 family protein